MAGWQHFSREKIFHENTVPRRRRCLQRAEWVWSSVRSAANRGNGQLGQLSATRRMHMRHILRGTQVDIEPLGHVC